MGSNTFIRANSLEEALAYKSDQNNLRVLAGGTDVMVGLNLGSHDDVSLLYIGECNMDEIKCCGDMLRIGAAATHSDITHSELVKQYAPILAEACSQIGSTAIRNVGTLGGNLINASPSADAATALLALKASVTLRSLSSVREVMLDQFFLGVKKTAIRPDEILEYISVPMLPWNRFAWKKVGRRSSDTISVFSVALALKLDNGICTDAGIALGSVAPTPLHAVNTEKCLIGQALTADTIAAAAACVYDEISPISDVRATAAYRRQACRNVLRTLLQQSITE